MLNDIAFCKVILFSQVLGISQLLRRKECCLDKNAQISMHMDLEGAKWYMQGFGIGDHCGLDPCARVRTKWPRSCRPRQRPLPGFGYHVEVLAAKSTSKLNQLGLIKIGAARTNLTVREAARTKGEAVSSFQVFPFAHVRQLLCSESVYQEASVLWRYRSAGQVTAGQAGVRILISIEPSWLLSGMILVCLSG